MYSLIDLFILRLSALSSSSSSSGRLPVGVGLGARDAAPRPGGEGPQGARPHQLAAPPARRQTRTADILPLVCARPSGPSGLPVFFSLRFALFLLSRLVAGSCLVPSAADLVM